MKELKGMGEIEKSGITKRCSQLRYAPAMSLSMLRIESDIANAPLRD